MANDLAVDVADINVVITFDEGIKEWTGRDVEPVSGSLEVPGQVARKLLRVGAILTGGIAEAAIGAALARGDITSAASSGLTRPKCWPGRGSKRK